MIHNVLIYNFILWFITGAFLVGWGFYFSNSNKSLFICTDKRKYIVFFVFFVSILVSLLGFITPFELLPVSVWAILFLIFSDMYLSLCMYITLVFFLALLYPLSALQIVILALNGIVGVLLYSRDITENKSDIFIDLYLVSYVLIDFTTYFILYLNSDISFVKFFFNSFIRILVTAILLAVTLFIYQMYIVSKETSIFDKINDPDYELLIGLKYMNESAYYHAVHTAYLSDQIARKIDANYALARALGYYHRIGLLEGDDSVEKALLVADQYHFPKALKTSIKQYWMKDVSYISKETVIVQICDALVSSITLLFEKRPKANLNYEKILNVIIKKKFETDDFKNCDLSLEELYKIKSGLLEEKLYYDFLRRK